MTEAAGILLSYDSKKMSALVGTNRFVKDRSRKSRSVQECSWTELAPGTISTYITMCITNSSRDFYSTERQARLCWQWQGKSVKYKHNVLYHSLHQETAVLLLCLAQLVKTSFCHCTVRCTFRPQMGCICHRDSAHIAIFGNNWVCHGQYFKTKVTRQSWPVVQHVALFKRWRK